MRECTRWGVLVEVLYFGLYPVFRYFFCRYFWKEVFVICTDTFLLSLSMSTPEASLTSFSRVRTTFDYFSWISSKFLFSNFSFYTQWVSLHFPFRNYWLFSCGFLLYFWENICFSMVLLKGVTSLLQLTVCREEWAFVRGRLDGDEAAVTLIPALGVWCAERRVL